MDLKTMTIKDYLIISLKGFLLGLISVGIPGISASTVGIIVGIYFLMVEAIANIFKDFKHNVTFLLFLTLGYFLGAIVAAFSVNILFEKFPLITTFAILGFIIASLPDMLFKLRKDFKKISCWIVFSVIVALLLLYNMLWSEGTVTEFPKDPDIWYLLRMGIIGVVTSATFIVPGIDFAVVFLSLGIYYAFTNMITELLNFGAPNYLEIFIPNIKILGVYLLGYGIGIFLFSKLIKFLTKKYDSQMQFASLAFVAAAPFIVIKSCLVDNKSVEMTPSQIVGIVISAILAFTIIITAKIFIKKKKKSADASEDNDASQI